MVGTGLNRCSALDTILLVNIKFLLHTCIDLCSRGIDFIDYGVCHVNATDGSTIQPSTTVRVNTSPMGAV